MKYVFYVLSIVFGIILVYLLFIASSAHGDNSLGIGIVFGILWAPSLTAFLLSLFLGYRESKVSITQTTSIDRIIRIIGMIILFVITSGLTLLFGIGFLDYLAFISPALRSVA